MAWQTEMKTKSQSSMLKKTTNVYLPPAPLQQALAHLPPRWRRSPMGRVHTHGHEPAYHVRHLVREGARHRALDRPTAGRYGRGRPGRALCAEHR